MFRLIRYRMLQIVREKGLIFWGLCFPIILGTFFYLAFGSLGTENFEQVPTALVSVSENQSFSEYLRELDGSLLAAKNAWGYPLPDLYETLSAPTQGSSLVLTIDEGLEQMQQIVDEASAEYYE